MILLTAHEIIELHKKIIAATGGSHGLRDAGLLDSAVFGCYQAYAGKELYPSIIEKAARLAYALSKNHPFVDGNKRVGVMVMLITLDLNGIVLSYTQQELVTLGLEIASSNISYEKIVTWINVRKK